MSPIDRTPDVNTSVIQDFDHDNVYERNGNVFQVGFGQEFGLECTTSSFFRSEWRMQSGLGKSSRKSTCSVYSIVAHIWTKIYPYLVPVIPQNDQGAPDYSVLVNHQPGQLYAFRNANNSVVLRTMENSVMTQFGQANIGIQNVAGGVYTCTAINGIETNMTEVTIEPTGEHCGEHIMKLLSFSCYNL